MKGLLAIILFVVALGMILSVDNSKPPRKSAVTPTVKRDIRSETRIRPTATRAPRTDIRFPPTSAVFDVARFSSPVRRYTRGKVNIREGPDKMYVVVGVVPGDSQIDIIGEIGDWYEINHNGKSAYISGTLIYVQPPSKSSIEQPKSVVVTATAIPRSSSVLSVSRFGSPIRRYTHGHVNLRKGPGTDYGLVGSVSAGSTLDVVAQSGDWYVIAYNGAEAYIAGWLTFDSPLAQPVQQQPANTVQQPPVNVGQQPPANVGQPPPANAVYQPSTNVGGPECDTKRYRWGKRGHILCSSIPNHMKPIRRGHCLYDYLDDREGDGIVCE